MAKQPSVHGIARVQVILIGGTLFLKYSAVYLNKFNGLSLYTCGIIDSFCSYSTTIKIICGFFENNCCILAFCCCTVRIVQ